jgi:hypothetical protein
MATIASQAAERKAMVANAAIMISSFVAAPNQ